MSFANKVVLVTGSGSGIGEATAILFAKENAYVVIVDCNEETASKTAEKCQVFTKRNLVIKADVSKEDEVKSAIEKTINEFGKLDVLINNAGIIREGSLLTGTIIDTYDEVLTTNLRSVILMTTFAIPHLIKTKGCIVNTASVFSMVTKLGAQYPAYTISKVGVNCFTQLSALELAQYGVRVNAVNPGPVYTNTLASAGIKACADDFAAATALKRCSSPQEIGVFILFLASDKAKGITGDTFKVDNGMSLL